MDKNNVSEAVNANNEDMTVMEIEQILGARIRIALDESRTDEERQQDNEQSYLVLGMAKQFLNGADLVLRGDKLLAQNKALKESRIDRILGH